MMLIIILLLSILLVPITTNASILEKIDEKQAVQPMPETSIKCGECPCVNPCSQQLPPPPPKITQYYPPQPQTPQSPRFYYFTGPPQPQTPPSPRFYYFTGPPEELNQLAPPPPRFTYVIGGPPQGNLHRTDPFDLEFYNGATTCSCNNILVSLLFPIICGLLEILIF
ncbi:hypothetical protein ACH5RR_011632 [Cinchona calisaya]|uniref:Uncharacterized protein n=1 Tax=Cinchona calisaya TaxID=153742 RepID=A0ABD3A7Z4_9GENT